MPATFISYRREDSAGYAGRLHEELQERFGPRQLFRDVDTLRAGQDFDEAIRQRLRQCQACVVMIGPNWLTSQTASGERRLHQPGDYVCMEIAAALARSEVLVIPVLVGGATMPAAEELPEAIRGLARRHAMSVRDETWEADMDRLAAALRQGDAKASPVPQAAVSRRLGLPRYVLPLAVALVFAAILLVVLRTPGGGSSDGPPESSTSTAGTSAGTSTPGPSPPGISPASDALAGGPASAIDVPSTGSEVSLGELIYTPLAGSVQRRGQGMRVWLRIRASNEGFYPANLWDDSFRLLVNGQMVPASGGLNEVLDRRSIAQAVVRFDVPSASPKAILRVSYQKWSGDIPLDLSGNGSAPKHEEPDPRDALSHAVVASVLRDETPLISTGRLSATILRSSVRRFVNTQRVTVVVKWTNPEPRYAVGSGDLILRLAIGGEVLAPVRQPSEVLSGGTTYVGDVVFEVPTDVRTVTLKASIGEDTVEKTLTLP